MKSLTLLFAILFLSLNAFSAEEWKIKEDGVSISIADKKFKGSFNNLTGTILFSADDLENSSFDVSISTPDIVVDGSGMQEKHVKSDKWLDVDKFNAITFKSTSIEKAKNGFVAKGTMTIHGVAKEVELPFKVSETEEGATFEGELNIDRKDYEVGPDGNTVASVTVSIKVDVTK